VLVVVHAAPPDSMGVPCSQSLAPVERRCSPLLSRTGPAFAGQPLQFGAYPGTAAFADGSHSVPEFRWEVLPSFSGSHASLASAAHRVALLPLRSVSGYEHQLEACTARTLAGDVARISHIGTGSVCV